MDEGRYHRIRIFRKIEYSKWYKNSVGVEFGPLVCALDLEEKWEKISGNRIFMMQKLQPRLRGTMLLIVPKM